jgi:hypothetical protein
MIIPVDGKTLIMCVLPRRSWFLMQPPSRLHGIGHTARVMVWAAVLTRGTRWFEPVVSHVRV